MDIEINGTHYSISRSICEYDMVRIYQDCRYITEVPYDKDWYEVAEIALMQIQRQSMAT